MQRFVQFGPELFAETLPLADTMSLLVAGAEKDCPLFSLTSRKPVGRHFLLVACCH